MMKLKENRVGEINHSQKSKCCRIPHTQGISKSQAGRRKSRLERYMGSCCSMGSLVTKNE